MSEAPAAEDDPVTEETPAVEEGAAVEEAGPTTDAAAEEGARRTQRERGGREGGRQAALARRPPTDRHAGRRRTEHAHAHLSLQELEVRRRSLGFRLCTWPSSKGL